jgi:osmotically-inducible protein OsmY
MNDIRILTPLAALVGLALIAGCDPGQGDRKSGAAGADTAVAQQEPGRAREPKSILEDAGRTADQAADKGKEVAGKSPDGAAPAPGKSADATRDAAITAAVRSSLAADPQLNPLKLGVDTSAGVVTLTGRAPDSKVAERAVQVAATANGVMRVENHLIVDGKS